MKRPKNHYVLNRQRKHKIDSAGINRFVSRLSDDFDQAAGCFSVVFITDKSMREYNKRYRGVDKTTDVLSFPGEDDYLGDILISAETAFQQAEKSPSLTFKKNVNRLLLHGLLHLAGFDHEVDNGEMRALELRLRRRCQC
jgi:probable rRNA maturation factor